MYDSLIDRLIDLAIEEDIATGDITTNAIIPVHAKAVAEMKAKADGVISGLEIAKQVFERFEKVDSFTQGAGLGLSICKSIVDKMNGRIWADSQLGIGTTFMVELPCLVTPIDA